MVSGSAALPVSTLARWEELSGHVLLERYGMTELGMALSNTLDRRVPGKVGEPLPNVEARIVDDDGHDLPDGRVGELLVRGPQVFVEYWQRPLDTSAGFVDGWFRTGDVAVHEPDGYRLLGRSSVDIIKTGGEKVSALEIEEVLRTHPTVRDCAVVGIADDEWGERVCSRGRPGRRGSDHRRGTARVGQGTTRAREGAVTFRLRRRAAAQHHGQGRQARRRKAVPVTVRPNAIRRRRCGSPTPRRGRACLPLRSRW